MGMYRMSFREGERKERKKLKDLKKWGLEITVEIQTPPNLTLDALPRNLTPT